MAKQREKPPVNQSGGREKASVDRDKVGNVIRERPTSSKIEKKSEK